MKKILLLTMVVMFFTTLLWAETEPNDTYTQANVVALNATGTGTAGLNNEQDWWRVTLPADGKLTVNWSSTNGFNVWCNIYDANGTSVLASSYTAGNFSVNADGLAAGDYYIELNSYFGTEATTYTFVPSFTPAAFTNDTEPNNTSAQAITMAVGDSVTGHTGYRAGAVRDDVDWWKVTPSKDGRIDFTLSSQNGQNVYAELLDGDGATVLAGGYTTGTTGWNKDGLAPGTYYIRIHTFYTSEFAPYYLKVNLVLPPNNTEGAANNDNALTAMIVHPGDSVNGHIGYHYNGARDGFDWYKLTLGNDGRLDFTQNSLNSQNIYLELFDGDTTTLLGGGYTTGITSWSKDGLGAGDYYFRVQTFYASEFGPYAFKVAFTPTVQNDPEPNGTFGTATVIHDGDSLTGHIGYHHVGLRDDNDWYKLVMPNDGMIQWQMSSFNSANIFAELFDGDGVTVLKSVYTSGTSNWSMDGLAAGTYYIHVQTYYQSEYGPYALKMNFQPALLTNDAEINDSPAQAVTVSVNSTFTGHTGYYYNHYDDTLDYYVVTLPEDGRLICNLTSSNGQNVYATLLDHDATTVLFTNYTTGTLTQSANNLAAGTYYIAVKTYYTNEFAPYSITLTFDPMNFKAENPADNSTAGTATLLPANTAKTGHLNYYYNLHYDNPDWWVIGYDGTGPMTITADIEAYHHIADYPYIFYYLYADTTAVPIASGTWHSATNSIQVAAPVIGRYYLRLEQGYNSFSAYQLTAAYTERCANVVGINSSAQLSGCQGTITYSLGGGLAPYTVQLYKDGLPYGSAQSATGSVTYNGLPIGTYYLRSWSFGGSGDCNNVSANTVFSKPAAPAITPSGATTFCQGGSVQLSATASSSYLWSTGATTQAITVSTGGSYTVTVYNAAGCASDATTTNVTVNPLPVVPTITPSGPTTFCQGSSVQLTSAAASTYLWSTSGTTQAITVTASGSYTVTVTNASGCSRTSAPVTVTVQPNTSWYADADGDGYGDPTQTNLNCVQPSGYVANNTDCNDASAAVHPGATELCNGIDDNCNGVTDEGCSNFTWYRDADGDGYGDPAVSTTTTTNTAPVGYVSNNTDCNDAAAAIHPGTTEVCNGIDDNCNGQIDEGVKSTFYADADGDGYGNASVTTQACTVPTGYVTNATDCDDSKATVHPGATEVCNDIDDNCNGQIDEGVKSTFYADADGDGYGNLAVTAQACTAPSGYVTNSTDCNDAMSAVHPGAQEVCNGIDDNCNGQIDEGCSAFTWYRDADGDGYGDPLITTTTSSNTAPTGYVSNNTDCNDAVAAVHPGAQEVCNGVDDNCDGQIDEGVKSTFYADADGDGYGNASATTQACTTPAGYVSNSTDCNDAANAVHPGAQEVCNGVDDNCDGQIDEGVKSTFYADADGDGYGNASVTTQACTAPAGYVSNSSDCNDAASAVHPGVQEVCNGIDDNCNGQIDEGCGGSYTYYRDEDGDGFGDSGNSITSSSATPPAGYVTDNTDCNDKNADVNPAAKEVCNGIDDNCNGKIDEGVPGPSASAGADQVMCSMNSTTLHATGTGTWSIVSGGSGAFSSTTNPTATFSGSWNKLYTLRWTVSGACGTATDDVNIFFVKSTYAVHAPTSVSGTKQNVCGTTQTYTALPANAIGTYNWSGWPAGTIINSQSGNSITVTFPSHNWTGCIVSVTVGVCNKSSCAYRVIINAAPQATCVTGPSCVTRNSSGNTFSVPASAGVTYSWSVPYGASITSGQGTRQISVRWGSSNGTVSCRISNGCSYTVALKYVCTGCRSKDGDFSLSASTEMTVYPNPGNGDVHLHIQAVASENAMITVSDLNGKVFMLQQLDIVEGEQDFPLNLTSLAKGVYVLELSKSDETIHQKLIIQ